MKHPCPCCGYRTHDLPIGGSMQICPVCFWEDAPGDSPYNGSNRLSLREAQRNFELHGASEQIYSDIVRVPKPEESRTEKWMTCDEFRTKLIDFLEIAFRDVRRNEGVTLHQAQVLDDYGSREEFEFAKRKDQEVRWQDISDEKISQFESALTFLDPYGFRFYFPAFLRCALRRYDWSMGDLPAERILWAAVGHRGYYADDFAIFSEAQKQCTAAFLKFVALHCWDIYTRDAEQALDKGWNEFLPEAYQFQ